MEIVYSKKVMKRIQRKAQSHREAHKRMDQLAAAPTFVDIPRNAKAHFLKGDLKDCFAVDFVYPARLICRPIGDYDIDSNGQFVKQTITAIEIVDVKKDYHSK